MSSRVVIVDYGMGNLLSVCRAFEHCGAEPVLSNTANQIEAAERLVLPGVGAFRDGMASLRERGLAGPLRSYCSSGRPFLGICLGMQMMMDSSEEFGHHEGLGLIRGTVIEIPRLSHGHARKTPHIGWNALRPGPAGASWERTILEGLVPGEASAYFVHSYAARPADPQDVIAECVYDGYEIAAVVQRDGICGCQFHPEKSGATGLGVIRRFCKV
jgi:glutamine amidotransferase